MPVAPCSKHHFEDLLRIRLLLAVIYGAKVGRLEEIAQFLKGVSRILVLQYLLIPGIRLSF